MPISVEVGYSKKLGLPKYSSHAHFVSVRLEVESMDQVEAASEKAYTMLQRAVDRHLKKTGFIPAADYGEQKKAAPAKGKGPKIVPMYSGLEKGLENMRQMLTPASGWVCGDVQRAMILNLVDEYDLKKQEVEKLSKELYGLGVRALGNHQADAFILELQRRFDRCSEDVTAAQ